MKVRRERILMTEPEDKYRAEDLVSEIKEVVANRPGARTALVVVTSKLAELIAALSVQANKLGDRSNNLQKWMICLTVAIIIMTLVLIVLTYAMFTKM